MARCSPWLRVFIVFVLLCFAGLQTASVVVEHAHEHGGPHSHCCPICHASHVPAMQAVAGVRVAAPAGVRWQPSPERVRVRTVRRVSLNSSRAPPQLVFPPRLSVPA